MVLAPKQQTFDNQLALRNKWPSNSVNYRDLELCLNNLKSVMSCHQVMTVKRPLKLCILYWLGQCKLKSTVYNYIFDMSLDNFVKLNQYNVTTFYDIKLNTKKEQFSQSQRNYYKWLSNLKSFMKNFNSILFLHIWREKKVS